MKTTLTVWRLATLAAVFAAMCVTSTAAAKDTAEVTVGFAKEDITPNVAGEKPVFIAGYGQNRRAAGVHDPLFARAIVLDDGQKRIAMAAVDVVGLQYPTVQEIRRRLEGFDYVLVASTHNHEGPDTVGLWGPSVFQSGVDPEYLESVVEKTAAAIQAAEKNRRPATGRYGTAEDGRLLRDSRLPEVKDDVLRVVGFYPAGKTTADKAPACLLVQWACHPEALASRNQQITADFPYYVIRDLEERYGCPVIYFSGAVGGLMAPPRGIYQRDDGTTLDDGSFEYAERYGKDVAALAGKAADAAEPVQLAPLAAAARPISVPLENPLYRTAQMLGVLQREGRVWTGDSDEIGDIVTQANANETAAAVTEVACVRLGDVYVAGIPGEIYPELVYGRVQDPVDAGADFPDAELEQAVVEMMPSEKFLLIGLANDELGYIIPARQWDERPPFAYGREKSQYGEQNSCGPNVAPVLLEALRRRAAELETP